MRSIGSIVLLTILLLGTASYAGDDTNAERVIDTMQASRNTDSTPPESILPSSPAIAGQYNGTDIAAVLRAKAVLTKLGYDVGRLDEVRSAKLKAAIYRFQRSRALETNGDLDAPTLKLLGIEHQ